MNTHRLQKQLDAMSRRTSNENARKACVLINEFVAQNGDEMEQLDIYFMEERREMLEQILDNPKYPESGFVFRKRYYEALSQALTKLNALSEQ